MKIMDVFGICYNFSATIYTKNEKTNLRIFVSSWWGDLAFESDWKRIADEYHISEIDKKTGYIIAQSFIKFYADLIQMENNDKSIDNIQSVMKSDIDSDTYSSLYWKIWNVCWENRLIEPWFKSNTDLSKVYQAANI